MESKPEMQLVWSVNPFTADRLRGVSALLVISTACYFAFYLGGPFMGMFALLVLVGGTGPFFVTTRYRLTPDLVEVSSPFQKSSRPWSDFKRVHIGAQGASLSPFAKRHFMEPYRSTMLRYGGKKQEILDWVSKYFGGEVIHGKA